MVSSLSIVNGAPDLPNLVAAALRRNWQQGFPQIAHGSKPGGLFIAIIVVLSALVLGAKQQRREEKEKVCLRERVFSHPLVAWLVENLCCVTITSLSILLVPRPKQGDWRSRAVSTAVGSILSEVCSNALMFLCSHMLYKNVDLFSTAGRPPLSAWGILKDWACCHMWIDASNALVKGAQTAVLSPHARFTAPKIQHFSPAAFLLKFAIVRICSDAAFWLGHRALHHPILYKHLHRKHHEHVRPSLATNYHFDPIDLYIEAFLPLFAGLTTLDKLGLKPGPFETTLILSYTSWHAVGSHCGKPLPVVTWFPPLAPLYQLAVGPERGVLHHDVHHARLNCNYSLAVWPDIVMGTRLEHHRGTQCDEQKGKAA